MRWIRAWRDLRRLNLSLLHMLVVSLAVAFAPSAHAQNTVDANDVPIDARWTVLLDSVAPGIVGSRLSGTDLDATARIEAAFDGKTHVVSDATVVFSLGNRQVQAITDLRGSANARITVADTPGLYALRAILVAGVVEASASEAVAVHDYIVEMPPSIEVSDSGVESEYIDAVLRMRRPDDSGTVRLVAPGAAALSDLEAIRFIASPELELYGTFDRSPEARIYETEPPEDGRMEIQIRSEWEGRYVIRAVGIGGAFRLRDQTLGQTEVVVSDMERRVSLEFSPAMGRFVVGPGRIDLGEVSTDDDTPVMVEIVTFRDGRPQAGVDVWFDPAPGSVVQVSGMALVSEGIDGLARVFLTRPGLGEQTITVSAEGAEDIVATITGVETETETEVAICPEAMRSVAERQGGVEICGTGRPDPNRLPHPLDGIWDIRPGPDQGEQDLIVYVRHHQSAEFAAAGRRMSVVTASIVGDPINPPWPGRIRHEVLGEDAITLSTQFETWELSMSDDPERLTGTVNDGGEPQPAEAMLRQAQPQVSEISVEFQSPRQVYAARRLLDRFDPASDEAGSLPVIAGEGPCTAPFVSTWLTLRGEGFAAGHDVWIDPASFLEISPQSGWVCAQGPVATINGGAGEGWGNCVLGADGHPAESVTAISVGLCPRPGIQPGPVDLWLNGAPIPFDIAVYASEDELPDFDGEASSEPISDEPPTEEEQVATVDEPDPEALPEEEEEATEGVEIAVSTPLIFTGRAADPVEIGTNQTLIFTGRAADPIEVATSQTLIFTGRAADPVAITTNQVLSFTGRDAPQAAGEGTPFILDADVSYGAASDALRQDAFVSGGLDLDQDALVNFLQSNTLGVVVEGPAELNVVPVHRIGDVGEGPVGLSQLATLRPAPETGDFAFTVHRRAPGEISVFIQIVEQASGELVEELILRLPDTVIGE